MTVTRQRTRSASDRIRGYILSHINAGAWKVGQQIPPESALTLQFSVSRMTVHRVLKELAAEGVIVRKRGSGSFVSGQVPRTELLQISDISKEIIERGGSYFCEVKYLGEARITAVVSHAFGETAAQNLGRSLIVHYEDGVPLQLEDRYVDLSLVPGYMGVDFTKTTAHQYLMQEAPLSKAEHELTAAMPVREQQEMLNIPAGEPCLVLKRKTWSRDRLVSYAELFYPASRYSFGGVFSPGS